MRFNYKFGTEASFDDWVDDGLKKAASIISSIEENEKEKSQDNNIDENLTKK